VEKSKISYLKNLFIPSLIILISLGFFGAFRLYKLEKNRKSVELDTSHIELRSTHVASTTISHATSTQIRTGKYVASRGGTTYHLPTCSGAKRISEKNKVYFDTKEEAAKFGYKPAKNCKGIEK
jgi:hypothetical protein